MPTAQEASGGPARIHGPTDFDGKEIRVRWISNHHHAGQELDLMLDWFEVSEGSNVHGLIGVDQKGLIDGWPPKDPTPFGKAISTMDKAISEMLA